MSAILQSLEKLTAEAHVLRQRQPTNAEQACRKLSAAVAQIRMKTGEVRAQAPKLDTNRIWSRFSAGKFELAVLDGLQFRELCQDSRFAFRREFVDALAREPSRLNRSRCLYAMVSSYFSRWRQMQEPEIVERLLIAAVSQFQRPAPAVRKWRSSATIFSADAASGLANEICAGQRPVDDVLKEHYVGLDSSLARHTGAAAARFACDYLRQVEASKSDGWTLAYLRWVTDGILSRFIDPDAFYYSISSLILSQSATRPMFKKALLDYVQAHESLRDPRIPQNSSNWRLMDPRAARLYLSWLARENIELFFNTILPGNSENHRRKDFWLRYQGKIRDFQVAVSGRDLWKVKASESGLTYSRIAHPTTSAFLMRLEGYGQDYIVVEFSETGNAAYIFNAADFEAKGVTMRTPEFDLNWHLKFDKTNRIVHAHDWESKAAYDLSTNFGIRP